MVALKLAKAGYCGGDPQKVLNMSVDLVVAAVQYEQFQSEYERAYVELNKERG